MESQFQVCYYCQTSTGKTNMFRLCKICWLCQCFLDVLHSSVDCCTAWPKVKQRNTDVASFHCIIALFFSLGHVDQHLLMLRNTSKKWNHANYLSQSQELFYCCTKAAGLTN